MEEIKEEGEVDRERERGRGGEEKKRQEKKESNLRERYNDAHCY